MTTNANYPRLPLPPRSEDTLLKWARRLLIPLAILAWMGVVAVILWVVAHIIRSLLLLVIAALLAYALAPVVKVLQRFIPRILAILIVYLIVLSALSLLLYLLTSTAIHQTVSFAHDIARLLRASPNGEPTPLEQTLNTFGISQAQIAAAREQIVGQIGGAARDAIPFLRGIFNFILDTIVVAVISIYLLIDGSRAANWLRRSAPRPARVNFLLDILQRVVGGYIRGQVLLAVLIGVLVGVGMELFHLPYAVFLGVLAFILAFVPVLGTFISGAVCVLVGLTHGWPIALGVLVYFIGVHIIEGDVVGPRIVGKAVGLHPVVSLFALLAGAELFGIWGALFASPLAGVLQALLIALWAEWRVTHPEQFPQLQEKVADKVE